jgi:dTDP-4-dehydrorhamnose 3,5-epimerase/CDP-3, 6-dideoxy-D-glycero-D-glycero-4-hexulose-5-epimerase
MEIVKTEIEWVFIIKWNIFKDNRWEFLKTFNKDLFKGNNLEVDFKESYFSISNKWVIRWMHFQSPPMDHTKLVYVSNWKIIDVLLDIRKWSKTYWKYLNINISYEEWTLIYITKWIAHGFISLEDKTIVNYMQTTCYSPENDKWILYNSFWYNWDNNIKPIISDRDNSFLELNNFDSPFIFWKNC